MKNIIAFLLGIFSVCAVKISTKPPANAYQYNGNFFWKVGKSDTYDKGDLHRTLFNDYPVCIYRDRNNSLIATSDVCIHRGASLSSGKLLENNCIQCPYHGWEYNNGIVKTVPGCPDMKGKIGTPRFDVKEINDDVYLSPTYDLNSKNGIIAKNDIYVPPESKDNNFVRI